MRLKAQPSQSRASGATALGSSSGTPRTDPRMGNIRAQQRVPSEQRCEVRPGERLAAGAAVQPLLPDAPYTPVELPQTAVVLSVRLFHRQFL